MSKSKFSANWGALLFALVFLPGLSAFSQGNEEKGIRFFQGSFAELKAKSASTGKPIFMDAYTSWCGPCKWMAKTVFTNEYVGEFYNEKFVCAKVDMEKGEGIELAKKFEVNAYPTLLFIDASGEVIHRSLGALDGPNFVTLGRIALDPDLNMAGLSRKFKAAPADFSVAYPYFFMLNDASLSGQLSAEVDSWFAKQPKATWVERPNWKMLYEFVESPENPAFLNMVASRTDFSARYTADSVYGKVRKVYFADLQSAAYNGDLARWKKDSTAIVGLNLEDGKRFIASSTIIQAGDDIQLSLSRTMDYMKNYGSENPGELNQFAWKMFEASENPAQLSAAESWAKKALELSGGDYMIHDTYASLLFKNKKYALAREEAGKAIQTGKEDGQDVSGTEDLLAKISHEINKPTIKAKPKPGSKSKKK